MKRIAAIFGMLVLLSLSYEYGHSRIRNNVVLADESPRWTKTDIPLMVLHYDKLGLASAQGFWQSTSNSKDKQLVSPIAVKIQCINDDKICKESEASVFFGVLQADLTEYEITSWTAKGIIADDSEDGKCGIGHRLSLDFQSNSVTVTDYPTKVTSNKDCKPFQDANSYSLHGGQLMLYPPAPWNPLAKPDGKK